MKKGLIFFFFIFFSQILPGFSADSVDDGLIWDYQSDRFLESLKSGKGFYDKATQRDLDRQIKERLNINLVPVDLECCLKIAEENNYNVKIAGTQKEEYKWLYMNSLAQLLPDFYYRYQIQSVRGEFLVET